MESSGDVAGFGPYVTSGSGAITQLTSLVESDLARAQPSRVHALLPPPC
jgi:hypothetical protein